MASRVRCGEITKLRETPVKLQLLSLYSDIQMASGKLRRYSKKIEDRDNPQPSLPYMNSYNGQEGSTTKW